MARTIYQRIALEGGKGIADELRKIGKDGEAAFIEIRGAAAKLSKDLGSVGKAFSDLGGSLATVGKRLGIAGGAVIGAAAGITALVGDAASAAKEIENLARVAGASPEEFQRLAAGAQTVGVEQDKLADILKDTQDKVGDFLTTGGGPLADFFKDIAPRVGVTANEFKKLSGPQALQLYFSSLEKANLSQAQMTFYLEAIASDSTLLLPLLRNNGREMERFGDAFARTGAILDNQGISALVNAGQSLRDLGGAISGARLQIASLLAPSVSAGADALTTFIAENRAALQDWVRDIVVTTLPILKDLGNAVIGNDIDVQNIWVLKAKLEILRFSYAVQGAFRDVIIPAYEALISVSNIVAEAINSVFGTDFTGQEILISAAIIKLVGGFGLLRDTIKLLGAAFGLGVSSMSLLTKAAPGLGTALGLLATQAKRAALAFLPLLGLPALLIAAFVVLPILLYVYWDEIVAGAKWLWDQVKAAFKEGWEFVKASGALAIEQVLGGLAALGQQFGEWGSKAGELFAAGLQMLVDLASQIWENIRSAAVNAIAGIAESASGLWSDIAAGAQEKLAGLVQIFSDLNASLSVVWEAIRNGASSVFSFLRDGFSNVARFVGGLFDGLASRIERVWNRIKSIIASAKAQYNQINENNTGTGSQREGVGSFATGGMVRGPGTGTSDSIMARLSNGEFVIRAAAVRKYGPQFFEAINRLRHSVPKFATGGLVAMPKMQPFNIGGIVDSLTHGMQYTVPRFADGGLVAVPAQSQGRPITLSIDGRTFDGLTASEKTAEDLSRYATNRRLKSAGRKPGWVG